MLEIGTILQDRFLIEAKIGSGGQGAVYLATDQKFGSRVAVKETIYDNAELAHAFEREARLLNSLHHPVLPHVSDIFSEDGRLLLVMEYIEGEDLSEPLKRAEALPIDDIVRWTFELLDALDYLHSQEPPIIHRDIKPNNLKITPRGNIVLLDFGLAKETSGSTLGMRSVFGYSRRYSPLEQIEGTGTDTRSDIFSLGATIFHLLTGEPPIDVLARASAIVAGRPDPLKIASDVNADVPVAFAALIKSAMSLNAQDRFATAGAMRTALEHSWGGDVAADELRDAAPAVDDPSDPVLSADAVQADQAASLADGAKSNPVSKRRRWAPPAPAVARTAAAAAVSAAAASRVKFRAYRNRSWRTPALVGLVVLILAGLGLGLYKSSPAISPAPEQLVEAAQTLPDNTAVAGKAAPIADDAPQYQQIDSVENIAVPEPAPAERSTSPKSRKNEPEPVRKRMEIETEPAPIVKAVEPERPRVVKAAPKRNRQPVYDDEPPITTIERIFTGRRDGGVWIPDQISEEEWQRRRQIRQMKRRGQRPPF